MASAPPKLKPPPGGDEHRGADIIVTQFVFGAIATILVGLRFYVRAKIVRKIGWDDWTILVAWIVTVIGLAFNCVMVREGFGRHQYYLIREPDAFIEANKYQSIWPPTFIIAVCLTRISICLFLLRIFSVNDIWRKGLYFMIGFVLLTNIPTFIFIFIQCRPFRKQWNPEVPGKCWPVEVSTKVGLYNGVVSVIIDWILAMLPIAFLWDMQLSKRLKVGVCALMSMGIFTGITSIVRTVITKRVIAAGKTADFSWISIDLRVWGELEILVGLIAACIPAVKPLYTRVASNISYPWSRDKSSKGYIEPSDEQNRMHRLRPVADPYSSTLGDTVQLHHFDVESSKAGHTVSLERLDTNGYHRGY